MSLLHPLDIQFISPTSSFRSSFSDSTFKKWNICMVCDFFFPSYGGIESHLYCLSQELLELGHKVIILSRMYDGPKGSQRVGIRWLTCGLKVYYLPLYYMNNGASFPTFFSLFPLFRNIMLREQIHIVHGHQEINRLSLTVPELPCYFAHILSNAEYEKNHLRIYAGYALKSYLHLHFNAFQASTLQFVQNSLLQSIQDGHPQVASLAGTLASYLLQHLPSIDQWPEVISHFAKWISEPNQSGFSAALKAVQQLCEDSAIQLIQAKTQPLTQLLPPLMNLIHSNDLQVIVMVIRSFAELASLTDEDDPHHYLSQLMENMFHPFLQTMLAKANVEPHLPFQQALCYFIVKVCQHNPERLFSHLDMVLHYILHCTQSENVELAMEASEFWICMAEHPGLHGYIHPFLPQLLPTLFQRLVYSQEELMELGDLNHVLDAHVPDSDQTIKPRHYRGKHHEPVTVTKTTPSTNNAPVLTTTVTTTTNTSLSSSSSHPPSTFHEAQLNSNHHFQEDLQKGKKKKDKVEKQLSDPINEQPRNTHQTKNPHDHQPQKEDENDNDDDEDEDDDEDSEDVVEQWTLRKCSAATLDILASVFENELLSPVLPLLKQHLIHPNWLHREAGILALGAMAEGCAEGLKAHLPELVPYLIKALNEE
ncbi:Transportin-1, partial [Coelomomyces lativittatus]